MNKAKAIFAVIVIFCLICIILPSPSANNKEAEQVPQEQETTSCRQAQIISETYVERILKSPSTAKFSNCMCSENTSDNSKYIVSCDVDSQNSFGAMVRSRSIVNEQYLGGEWSEMKNWQLNILVFDEEVIYQIKD